MSDFTVDYSELNLAQQLLVRQHEHVTNLREYSDAQFRIDQFDFGLILQVFYPLNELAVSTANFVSDQFSHVIAWSAEQTTATLEAYLQADRAAHERFRSVMTQLGFPTTPYEDPAADFTTLGAAASSATADYGARDQSAISVVNLVNNAYTIGEDAAHLVGDTVTSAVDRLTTLGARGGVSERTNPSSYLVVPDPGDDPGGELRLNAGLILGGCDWVAEQIFGVSILEEYIYKPFGGDWHAIGRASAAWEHGSQFHMELAANFTGLPGQLISWTGLASAAFQTAVAALGAASYGLSTAYLAVSGMVGTLGSISKLICSLIATALRKISNKLMRMAIEASIPVAGWVVAAVEGVILVGEVLAAINLIVNLINMLLDAIIEFIAAKDRIVEASLLVEDLLTNIGNRAVSA